MPLPSDSILVFDMGYYDFSWWNKLDSMNSWFVTRSKDNLDYQIVEDFDVSKEKDRNVLEDSNIRLKGKADYPKLLRRVRYWDEVNKNELVFITNQQPPWQTFIKNVGISNPSLS